MKRLIKKTQVYSKLAFMYWKYNFQGMLSYRKSFIIAAVFMLINNLIMVSLFYLFFKKFDTIGGMDWNGYIHLMVVVLLVFSIMHLFFYGFRNLSDKIVNGQLDAELLLPKNLLARLLLSGIEMTAIGDLATLIIYLIIVPDVSLVFLIKLLLVGVLGAFVFIGFMLIFHATGFWIGSSRELTRAVFEAVLSPSHYPQGAFTSNIIKVMFVSVLPVFFVTYLPYNMMTGAFTWTNLLILLGAAVLYFGIGCIVFYRGLKRYESGNMMQLNA